MDASSVVAVYQRLADAAAEVRAISPEDVNVLSGEDLDAVLTSVWEASDRAVAATSIVAATWAQQGRFRLDGSRSASARLARDTGSSRATAARVLRRGRFLRERSAVADALAVGDLTPDKADVLARAAIPARRDLFAEAEAQLLADAKRLSCDDLARVATYWGDVADDHLGRDRSRGAFEARRLTCARTLDGSLAIDGRLDAVAGAIVEDELERLGQQLFDEDWSLARAQHGPLATADQLPRTATQRRADALRIMATRSGAMLPGAQPRLPLFNVHLGEGDFVRTCELADGTVVPPGALVPWLPMAEVERIVHDPPSRIIDVGRRTRFFRGALRRAIEVRDRHCTFPGCTVPAERCDVDHIIEYVNGGPTTQANGRLRCPAHNRQRPGRQDGAGPLTGPDAAGGPDP